MQQRPGRSRLVASVVTLALACLGSLAVSAQSLPAAALGASGAAPRAVQPTPKPEPVESTAPGLPDVVVVVADDLRKGIAEPVLRQTSRYVSSRGSIFTNAVVTTPHCCPSRSMILTGKYAHTTGVWDNGEVAGGWKQFKGRGLEGETLAVALQRRGYRTGLIGKYLNGFQHAANPQGNPVPRGWSTFETFSNISKTGAYTGYALSGVGQFGAGAGDYSTDVIGRRAAKFVNQTASDQPLFLMMTPYAPHSPSQPAERDALTPGARLPLDPALRSADGKPGWVRAARATRSGSFFAALERRRARERASMKSFDQAVGRVAAALEARGRLRNTIFVVTSDNGYLHGDYGLAGKNLPYRTVTDVPLYVSWPAGGVPRGKDRRLATMTDIPTTIAAATGARMRTEGINLFAPDAGTNQRLGVMLEGTSTDPARPAYCGFRTKEFRYARYSDGSAELYDLRVDPQELKNLISEPWYSTVATTMRQSAKRTCRPTAPGFAWDAEKPTSRAALARDESATEE